MVDSSNESQKDVFVRMVKVENKKFLFLAFIAFKALYRRLSLWGLEVVQLIAQLQSSKEQTNALLLRYRTAPTMNYIASYVRN